MKARNTGILQSYAESKDSASDNSDCSLSDVLLSSSGELQRATKRRARMAGMSGRGSDNFIRWCHRCKHEVPEYLKTDMCDLCGGEIIKISSESEDKQ